MAEKNKETASQGKQYLYRDLLANTQQGQGGSAGKYIYIYIYMALSGRCRRWIIIQPYASHYLHYIINGTSLNMRACIVWGRNQGIGGEKSALSAVVANFAI
jgi:hypothetical protein